MTLCNLLPAELPYLEVWILLVVFALGMDAGLILFLKCPLSRGYQLGQRRAADVAAVENGNNSSSDGRVGNSKLDIYLPD